MTRRVAEALQTDGRVTVSRENATSGRWTTHPIGQLGKVERPWLRRRLPLVAFLDDLDACHMPTPLATSLPCADAYRIKPQNLITMLDTDQEQGLSSEQVEQRLAQFGPNALPVEGDGGALLRFVRQFRDPLVYVLLAAAIVTLSMGQFMDSGVILGVLLNAAIGYV